MSEVTTAVAVAEGLKEAGCRHAFGVPGGEVLDIVSALESVGIKVQLVKHENCAGFMAEGTWHADGAPGVLFATIGPGIANATNVIANAWQDRVPLIVLTASVSADQRHSFTHQVFDHLAVLSPITKAAFLVESGAGTVLVDKALRIATSGRPGPVLLDIPTDVQKELVAKRSHPSTSQQPMVPAPAAVAEARLWLGQASRPLVIAGLDVVNEGCHKALTAFCESFGAPLLTTYKAKGTVPEDHPLALGGAGLSPVCDEILMESVERADCVVLAGYDPIEMRIGWQNPFHANQRVIDIGAEPNVHYMHQAQLNFTGHVGQTLIALGADTSASTGWGASEVADARARINSVLRRDEPWGPAAVIDQARRACPRDTVATVDSGAHRIVLNQLWDCYEPRGLLQSSGLCTMGGAVPLAVGRKLAEPDRPVVAFVGDAGLEMYLGELATIRDLELGIPIVVFVDQQLALIELKQRTIGLEPSAVDFPATDFCAVAAALGGSGVEVHGRGELERSITEAFERDTFTIIAATIGQQAYDGRI